LISNHQILTIAGKFNPEFSSHKIFAVETVDGITSIPGKSPILFINWQKEKEATSREQSIFIVN